MTWVHYSQNKLELNLNNNIMTVWSQQKLFSSSCQKCLVSFTFLVTPLALWWSSNHTLQFVRGFLSRVQLKGPLEKTPSTRHRISAYAILSWKVISRKKQMPLRKGKGPLSGKHFCFSEEEEKKALMSQSFSRQNSVPDGGGNTDEQKGDSQGSEAASGGWRPGLGTLHVFVGVGSPKSTGEGLPATAAAPGNGFASLAAPHPALSPQTPQRGRTAVPLRFCWLHMLSSLCVVGSF